ncbi:MAG: hypothetical protein K2X01_07805 [Cyanobacteria bacterium]|nr:hypothetical protein [Cyanobacteriota bacterium]
MSQQFAPYPPGYPQQGFGPQTFPQQGFPQAPGYPASANMAAGGNGAPSEADLNALLQQLAMADQFQKGAGSGPSSGSGAVRGLDGRTLSQRSDGSVWEDGSSSGGGGFFKKLVIGAVVIGAAIFGYRYFKNTQAAKEVGQQVANQTQGFLQRVWTGIKSGLGKLPVIGKWFGQGAEKSAASDLVSDVVETVKKKARKKTPKAKPTTSKAKTPKSKKAS